ncbi:cell division control protein 45 [Coprinopsis cinerea okayama7|uniref:Cell division control protein 45 n=1 Tax=Coprinopsis cinerea (strain Okayama-7 / 130 / ATCC MYA-4618 / FGSC 9003) TaxID=240176 RepID=A8NGB3_COPC7|nr:cell division control protein 45 [Coprinopsis cinerea okayama7\|eukprot:XP_001833395.2 cell division control protein 45 [Coprinopsis cinerea okayama7\
MVYIPPPHLAQPGKPSYSDAYNNIISAYRRSPQTSASSVIMLVAPDVDALCAARMLASLLTDDDVVYRVIPVSSVQELQLVRDELSTYTELHTLILINMGNFCDLPTPQWFGEFDTKVCIHVIDSSRPRSMANLFAPGENGERVVLWDDGDAEKLGDLRKAWETLEFEPLPDSDDEESDDESFYEEDLEEEAEDDENGSPNGKRKSREGERDSRKRRKLDESVYRVSREEVYQYKQKLNKYYYAGTSYGQSAASTVYILATVLERVDNDLLWLAILGLTYQYATARISRDEYEQQHSVYHDEVSRLNPLPSNSEESHSLNSLSPDDWGVRPTEELRFMLFRHWNLYDAMYHSSYVASKLGIWKERGRKRLTGLLAKMGFSVSQTQQPYSHMDMDLKRALIKKLDDVAPEYGLVELSYPSFMRCYGYHSQPLSAADAVESVNALLDFAGGTRMEIELEGHRNGGEWFGGGKQWEAAGYEKDVLPAIKPGGGSAQQPTNGPTTDGDDLPEENAGVDWWKKNFWSAYDALTDIRRLREAISLAMAVHKAIIRQGTSIIDKQDIKTMRNHRVVVLTQGPDLHLFHHPGMLTRLALWLIDALRDRLPATAAAARSKRKDLPFIVACLNEAKGTYIVAGIMASPEFGDIRRNTFSTNFLNASATTNTEIQHTSFNTNVIEIDEKDLKPFLEALCS